MNGESPILDRKVTFDHQDPKAKLELVRDLVAIANTGGGRIVVGHDEVNEVGITEDVVEALDSSRVAEWLANFASPVPLHLSHDARPLTGGRFLLTLTISAAEFPIVISKRGLWKGADSKRDRPVFEPGDIFVRHSTRTERANYEDIRSWVLKAREAERESILDRITTFVKLPEGAALQVVSQAGHPIDTPGHLLDSAISRREHDPGHLLSPHDLLWLFQLRQPSSYDQASLCILIASALRRNPTLYWWLLQADMAPEVIKQEVSDAFHASDRDRSDAGRSITEVASIYLDREAIREVLSNLRSSRYEHFRREAAEWESREQTLRRLARRIRSAKWNDKPLLQYPRADLESRATAVAADLIKRGRSLSLARRLSDLTRAIWALESSHATFVREATLGAA
jgi:hypothetical protein